MAAPRGRSRGCRTCRMRHVKCDEAKPICNRCQKAKMFCRGYDHIELFVDEAPRILEAQARSKAKKQNAKDSSRNQLAKTAKLKIADGTLAPLIIRNYGPGRQLDLSPFAQDIYYRYLMTHLFDGQAIYGADTTNVEFSPWLIDYVAKTTPKQTPTIALDALARIFFGKMNHVPQAEKEGIRLYCSALACLKDAISRPDDAYSHWVLTTALNCELIECIAFTSQSAWLQHARGIGALIEARTPYRHQEPFEHGIFRSCRMFIIFAALIRREHVFLEREEWKTIPWAKNPSSKTRMCYLADILSDLPGLFTDFSKLAEMPPSPEKDLFYINLSQSVASHLSQVYAWRWDWEAAHPRSCTLSVPSEAEAPFSTIITYDSLVFANAIAIYQATHLLFLRLLQALHPRASPFSYGKSVPYPNFQRTNPLILPGDNVTISDCALEILRSIDYHLLSSHSSQGSMGVLFPLRVAWIVLTQMNDEWKYSGDISEPKMRQWMASVAHNVVDDHGFALGISVLGDIGGFEGLLDPTWEKYRDIREINEVDSPATCSTSTICSGESIES